VADALPTRGELEDGMDLDGNGLGFRSTTGSLWVSEDQGESWVCVTHTLPPVYAVQFVLVVWHPKSHPDYIDSKFAALAYNLLPSKNLKPNAGRPGKFN
jgi:hypothetical protein